MNIQMKQWKFFCIFGMMVLVLSLLASCGGSSGGRDTTAHVSRLTLRLTTATESLHGSTSRTVSPSHARQAGAARLVITVEGEGIDSPIMVDCELAGPPTAECRSVTETEQASRVEIELMIPRGPSRRIRVTVFDASSK